MKKYILGSLAFLTFLSSCSIEDPNSSSLESLNNINETQNTQTSLFDEAPKEEFDATAKGLYHGIFSSYDLSERGQLYINVGNNGNYNAELQLLTGDLLTFSAQEQDVNTMLFVNERATFIFNTEYFENPVASDVLIDGKESYIKAYKEYSTHRTSFVLGTFIDENDPSFTGNWNVVTDGLVTVANDYWNLEVLYAITEVNISRNNNNFTSAVVPSGNDILGLICNGWVEFYQALPSTDPFFYSVFAVDAQSTFLNETATWSMQALAGDLENFTGCDGTSIPGTWSWNGRSGTFTFEGYSVP